MHAHVCRECRFNFSSPTPFPRFPNLPDKKNKQTKEMCRTGQPQRDAGAGCRSWCDPSVGVDRFCTQKSARGASAFSLFLWQPSTANQTHNSLLQRICFMFGSAVETPHDVICRTEAILASLDHVPHIGRVLGGDSLRSATVSLTLVRLPGCLCHMLRSSDWV